MAKTTIMSSNRFVFDTKYFGTLRYYEPKSSKSVFKDCLLCFCRRPGLEQELAHVFRPEEPFLDRHFRKFPFQAVHSKWQPVRLIDKLILCNASHSNLQLNLSNVSKPWLCTSQKVLWPYLWCFNALFALQVSSWLLFRSPTWFTGSWEPVDGLFHNQQKRPTRN